MVAHMKMAVLRVVLSCSLVFYWYTECPKSQLTERKSVSASAESAAAATLIKAMLIQAYQPFHARLYPLLTLIKALHQKYVKTFLGNRLLGHSV
jgi:hypothetical protein